MVDALYMEAPPGSPGGGRTQAKWLSWQLGLVGGRESKGATGVDLNHVGLQLLRRHPTVDDGAEWCFLGG